MAEVGGSNPSRAYQSHLPNTVGVGRSPAGWTTTIWHLPKRIPGLRPDTIRSNMEPRRAAEPERMSPFPAGCVNRITL